MVVTPFDVTVRQADRADLLDVLRIERACFPNPWTFDAFERFLGESAFLVAEQDADVVGYAIADSTPNLGRDIGHLKDLAVRPASREQGIGRVLLHSALARLYAQGATVVKLEVREDNDVARSLYADEGFEPVRRLPRYYPDGEDALVLLVDLRTWRTGS